MKIKQTLLALTLLVGFSVLVFAPFVSAENCGDFKTSVIPCGENTGGGKTLEGNRLWDLLLLVINILSAGVGVAGIGGVVYGSIMYTTARGSQEQVTKARVIIANTVVGLIAFALLYSFLQFIVPGGVF